MTETERHTHPALQTDNYVPATTLVPDKYGIIQLANDLLIAMHEVDMNSFKDDTTEDVNLSSTVSDVYVQLTGAMEDLAKDMGGSAAFAYGNGETAQVVHDQKANAENATVEVNDAFGLMDLTMALLEEQGDKRFREQKLIDAVLDYVEDFAKE